MGDVLADLIARVEAANHGSIGLDVDIMNAVWPEWEVEPNEALHFITSSLDAALALVERKLPGWKVSIFINHLTGHKAGAGARAALMSPKKKRSPEGFRWPAITAECFYAPTPALAVCAALLRALQHIARDGSSPKSENPHA